MKLCKELILKAEEGVNFKVTEGDNNQILITAFKVTTTASCSANYANPPIPDGYKYVCGKWNTGFVIERKSDGSQFVWVPVGSLEDNERELEAKSESVKKYGGFYISRFNISRNLDGKPQSLQGKLPWVNISFSRADSVAKNMEKSDSAESHITLNEEYNCVLQWLISTHAATYSDLHVDSKDLGNYWDSNNGTHELAETGSCEEWCLHNIYDFVGNVMEWTSSKDVGVAIRGGSFTGVGCLSPAAYYNGSCCLNEDDYWNVNVGFRVVLYIK